MSDSRLTPTQAKPPALVYIDLNHWISLPSGASQSKEEEFYEATDALMQFMMLRGPTDEELPALEDYGFNPMPAHELIDRIARREAELAGLLSADPSKIARLDDIVDARPCIGI